MKNEYRVCRPHGSYFFKSFPKQNVTIMWDSNAKKYQFYNGIIDTNEVKPIEPIIEKHKDGVIDFRYIMLGTTLGILLGIFAGIAILIFK